MRNLVWSGLLWFEAEADAWLTSHLLWHPSTLAKVGDRSGAGAGSSGPQTPVSALLT